MQELCQQKQGDLAKSGNQRLLQRKKKPCNRVHGHL